MKWYRKILARLIEQHCPAGLLRGAEVGVANGKTSEYLLRSIPRLSLLMVDRWCPPLPGSPFHKTQDTFALRTIPQHLAAYRNAMGRTEPYADRRSVRWLPSVKAAEGVAAGSLDFVFIDGDHSYEGCYADLVAWRPKLKPQSLFCGHDYVRNCKPGFGVWLAVNQYASECGFTVNRAEGSIWWAII